MKQPSAASLARWIPQLRGTRILVVGDVILDEFVWGEVTRISPEAPVPVVHVHSQSHMPGGAANVAANVRALGGKTAIAGVTGRDRSGEILRALLTKDGISVKTLLVDPTRATTVKTRVVANSQQVVRYDHEDVGDLPRAVRRRLIQDILSALKRVDGVIIEDYGKGVINEEVLEAIVPEARRLKRVITVDPKVGHFPYYTGVTAITPNRSEAGLATGMRVDGAAHLNRAGQQMLSTLSADAVLVTLGEEGMSLFQPKKQPIVIPTVAQEVYDVAGAGDTVIGTFTLALAAGADFHVAAHLANFAAGVVVGQVGVAVITPQLLTRHVRAHR